MIESLSYGHQLANLLSTAGMAATLIGICVYGYLTEHKLKIAVIEAEDEPPAGPRVRNNAHLAGVTLPPVSKPKQHQEATHERAGV